jgi:Uma2 family endonuclease
MANQMLPPPNPHAKMWTRAEYECMVHHGILGEDDHVELLNGEIVETMPQNSPHAMVLLLLMRLFFPLFGMQYQVRFQLPLAIAKNSSPEPDMAIVEGDARAFPVQHPTTAELIVEVSDATLDRDRTDKAEIYAEAGIADYWIININDRVVEVHRDPAAMSGTSTGYGYRSVRHCTEPEQIAPLFAPQTVFAVQDLLP